ncbi:MAG TPA: hypothetical protein VGV92_08810 [Gammaproteobacteria bacterium]|nr:hypothetical protein [Gammaproteobacteria bacterium]
MEGFRKELNIATAHVYYDGASPLQPIFIRMPDSTLYHVVDSTLEKIDPLDDELLEAFKKVSFTSYHTEHAISQDQGRELLESAKKCLQQEQEALETWKELDTGNNNAQKNTEEESSTEEASGEKVPLLSGVAAPVAESTEAPAEEVDETSPLAARNPQITIRFTPKNNSEMRKAIVAANLTGTLQPRHQKVIETNTERRWYIFETEHKTIKIILDHSNGIMRWVAPENVTDAQIKTAYTEMLKLRGQLKLENPKTSSARFSLDQKAVILLTRDEYIAELRRIQNAQHDRLQDIEGVPTESSAQAQTTKPGWLARNFPRVARLFGGASSQSEKSKQPTVSSNTTEKTPLLNDVDGPDDDLALNRSATTNRPVILPTRVHRAPTPLEGSDEGEESVQQPPSPKFTYVKSTDILDPQFARTDESVENQAPRPLATTATVFYDDNDKKNWVYVEFDGNFYAPGDLEPIKDYHALNIFDLKQKEFNFKFPTFGSKVRALHKAADAEYAKATTATVYYNSKTFAPTMIEYREKYYTPDGTEAGANFATHLTRNSQTFLFAQEPGSDNFARNLSVAAIARTQIDERMKYSPSDDIFHELEAAEIDFLVEDKNTKKLVATDAPSQTVFAEIHFVPEREISPSEAQVAAAALKAKFPNLPELRDSTIQFHRPGVIRLKRTPGKPFSENLINTTIDTVFELSHELKIAPTGMRLSEKLLSSRKLSNSAEARFKTRTRGFHRIEVGFTVESDSFEPGSLFTHLGRIKKQLEALGFEIHPIARGGGREPTWHLANRDDYDPRSTYELQVVKRRGSDNKYILTCIAPSHAKLDKLDAAVSASIMLCLNVDGIQEDSLRISEKTVQTSPLDITPASFRERREEILHAQQLGFAIAFERRVPSDLTEQDKREIGELGFLISEPDKHGNSTFTNNGTVITVTRNAIECIVPRDATDDDIRDALKAMSIASYSLGHSPKLLLDPNLKQHEKAKLKRIFKAASAEHKPAIEIGYRLKAGEDLPFILSAEDTNNGFSIGSGIIRYTGKNLSEEAAIRRMLELRNDATLDPHSLILVADENDAARTARLQTHFNRHRAEIFPVTAQWIALSFTNQPGVTLTQPITADINAEAAIKILLGDAKEANVDPATIQLNSSPAFTRAEKRDIKTIYDRVHNEAFAPSRAFRTGVTLPLYTNGIDIATFVNTNRADLTRFFARFGHTLNGLTLTNRANGNVLDIDPANNTIALRHVTGETDDAKLEKIEGALNAMYEFQRVLTPDADPANDINAVLIETTNDHNSPFHGDHSDAIETTVIRGDGVEAPLDIDVRDEVFDNELEHRVLVIPFAGKNNPIAANLAAGLPVPALPVSDDYEIVIHPNNTIELVRKTNPLLHSQEMGIIQEGIDEILSICEQLNLQPQTPIINPAPALNDYRSEIEAYVESGVKALPKWVELRFTGSGSASADLKLAAFYARAEVIGYRRIVQGNSTYFIDGNNTFEVHRNGNNFLVKSKLSDPAAENDIIKDMLLIAHDAEATRESLNFTPDRNLIPAARDRIQGIYTTVRDEIFPRPFEFAITFERRVAYSYLHAYEITALSRLGFADYSDPEDTRQYGHYRFENRASGIVITLENGDLNCTMPRRPITDPAVPAAMNNEINNALDAMFMMGYSLGHNLKLNQNQVNPLFDTAANPEKANLKARFNAAVINTPRPRIFIQFTPKAGFTPTPAEIANANARLAPEGISFDYNPAGPSVIRYELNQLSESDAIKRMIEISNVFTDDPNSLVVTSDHMRKDRIEREFNKHRAERYPFAFTFKGQTAADIALILGDDDNRNALKEKAQTWGFKLEKKGTKYYLQNKNSVIALNDVDGKMICRMKNPPATQEQINEAVKAMMGVAALLHVNPAQLNLDHRLPPELVDDTRDHFTKMRDQFFPSKTKVDIRPTDPVLNLYTRLDANLEELNRRLRPLFFKLKKVGGLYLLEGEGDDSTKGITLGIGDDGVVYLYDIKAQKSHIQENKINFAIEAAMTMFKHLEIPANKFNAKVTGLEEKHQKRLQSELSPNAMLYLSTNQNRGETHVEYVRINDRWFRNLSPNDSFFSYSVQLEEMDNLPPADVLAKCRKKKCYLNPNHQGSDLNNSVEDTLKQGMSFALHSTYSNNGRFIRQCIEERGVREAINAAQAKDPDTGFKIQPDGYHLVNEHSKVKIKRNADGSRQSNLIGGYTKDQVSDVAKELLNMIEAQMREDAVLMEKVGAQAFPKEIVYRVTAESKAHTVEDMKIIRAAIEHVRTDFETLKAKYPALQGKCRLENKAAFVQNTEPVIALGAAKKRKRDDADAPIEPGIGGAVRPRNGAK